MDIVMAKGTDRDWLTVTRDDGSEARLTFPKKGHIPHDAVHFFVEKALGFDVGFWGSVAAGGDPDSIQEMAKQAGHASAKRAARPDADIVQLLQAERLVECFEAALWADELDLDAFLDTYRAACESSHVPLPDLSSEAILELFTRLREFAADWSDLSTGQSITLVW
ncbi:MAG: hypothetical protein ACTS1Z_06965 [Parasphingopyxis sp.]|uniref:hypothetical protein n=1 Tax=Parasphingopyxis sp. TaxID=1920299 RepID=UPI003F9FAE39